MMMVSWLQTARSRKNTEAVTGLLLLLFCVEHFAANAMLLLPDPTWYRWYTNTLGHSLAVRALEVLLFILFVVHIALGLHMRYKQRALRARSRRTAANIPFATRFVGTTGAVILIFLVVHLARFFVPNRVYGYQDFDLYTEAYAAFRIPWYTALYVFSMAALALHLHHGAKSSVVVFSRLSPSTVLRVRRVVGWLAVGVPLALGYIAVHIGVVQWLR